MVNECFTMRFAHFFFILSLSRPYNWIKALKCSCKRVRKHEIITEYYWRNNKAMNGYNYGVSVSVFILHKNAIISVFIACLFTPNADIPFDVHAVSLAWKAANKTSSHNKCEHYQNHHCCLLQIKLHPNWE